MSTIAYVLTIMVAFVHVTFGNFDMYRMHGQQETTESKFGQQPDGWMLFNDTPRNCDDVHPFKFWPDRSDVSHGRRGVVCEGKGCWVDDWPWPNIKRVEMHFCKEPDYHFTIYKDKGRQDGDTWMWTLFDLYNNKKGECFAYGGVDWDCRWPPHLNGHPWLLERHMWAQRKFRCIHELDATDFVKCAGIPDGRKAGEDMDSTAVTFTA
ncbi:hypothetical protein BU23DRAFT_202155 [Bimuria novae-zelandiae CBS 107.79]|uniref:Uncharacterized protein n=1 Tax=Bimuria novae-zelandiae CBS 107.79 TaxID=1447943 RepID=A0A6A5V3U9_9PLEO|nr:hypothetical protein BU23DRAFT_202155 [Bimuria novae-zelandiae CBS 107.79]